MHRFTMTTVKLSLGIITYYAINEVSAMSIVLLFKVVFLLFFFFSFYGLGLLASFNSKIISETTNPFTDFWLNSLDKGISPLEGLYLQRTAQQRKLQTNIHTLSGI